VDLEDVSVKDFVASVRLFRARDALRRPGRA
jgi:hypothetical protein